MTSLQIISDLHTESYEDAGVQMIKNLPVEAPILVVAGDVGNYLTLPLAASLLVQKWEHVVMVAGNHDYGELPKAQIDRLLKKMQDAMPNFHWLNNESRTIAGVKFFGGTMWFPQSPMSVFHEGQMWDFQNIPNFRSWVYKENTDFKTRCGREVDSDTVVVTHHLPHPLSVSRRYKNSPFNKFFVCNMDRYIAQLQPKLWIHGHTHHSFDYELGDTRIVCNPLGYGLQPNRTCDLSLTVEV